MSTRPPNGPGAQPPEGDLDSAVAELGARIVELDPEFGRMSIEVGQRAWSSPDLSPRQTAFLCLANDVLCQHLGLPLRLHVEMALANGVPSQDLREVIRHLAPYAGYPACVEAFVRLAEIEASTEERGRHPTGEESAHPEPQDFVFPPAQGAALRDLDAPYADFVVQQTELMWNRPHMTHLERAYLSLAADVCHQTLDESFRLHVALALKSGASRQGVRSVLRFLAEFGMAKAWRALRALEGHVGDLEIPGPKIDQSAP